MNPAMREGVLTVTVKNVVPLPKGVESPFVKVLTFTTNPRALRAPSLPPGSPRRGPSRRASGALTSRPGRTGDWRRPAEIEQVRLGAMQFAVIEASEPEEPADPYEWGGCAAPVSQNARAALHVHAHAHTHRSRRAAADTRAGMQDDAAALARRPGAAALGATGLAAPPLLRGARRARAPAQQPRQQRARRPRADRLAPPPRRLRPRPRARARPAPPPAPYRPLDPVPPAIPNPPPPAPASARPRPPAPARARPRPPAPARARPRPHARPARESRSFDLREERVPRLARHLHPDRGELAACPACRRAIYLPRPTPLHAHPALREAAKPRYFPWLRDYSALHNVGPRPLASPRPHSRPRAACYPARCGSLTNKRGVASHVIARGHCSAAPAR